MKKIFTKSICLLLALPLLSVVANANNNKDYKSTAKAYVEPTGAGTVYVAAPSGGTNGSWGSTSTATKTDNAENAPSHTYSFQSKTNAGYTFNGWSASKNGSIENTNATYSKSINAAEGNGSTLELYARWTANEYTVTFYPNGEGATVNPTSKKVTYAAAYGELPTPARRFYTFESWYTEATNGSKVTTTTTVSTASDHTLYAHWILTPEEQTLNWGTMLFNMAVGSRQPIAPASNSGLTAFTCESDNESVISVDGEYLVANAAGEANITIRQAGNDYFKPAELTAKFTVLNKETPDFRPNGFNADVTNELKVDDIVTLNLTYVSDGLNGDFTAVASTENVIGIAREGNTLTFTALHAGSASITLTQTENNNIFAATQTYTFNVTRYEPEFSLSDTELELEETATLTLNHIDGQSITFAPEGIVSYDASTGVITAVAPGTTTLIVSQPQTNSIEAKEEQYTITVSKKAPTLTVFMNNAARTSLSVGRGASVTIAFEKVSDAEVVVTNVSGAQYASYANGMMTAGAEGTAKYRATLPETDTYQAISVDFTLTVTANNNHLPISITSESTFNNLKSGSSGDYSWKGNEGFCVGGYNGWLDGVANWDDKYVTFKFEGVPNELSFESKFIYRDNIANKMTATTVGGSTVEGQLYFLYVDESADGKTWSAVWNDQELDKDNWKNWTKQLKKTTRYIRFHLHANYGALYRNIKVTELSYVEDPEPASIDFGSAVINSGEVSKTTMINWCNVSPLTVTSSNPRFTVTPAQFGNFDQFATQTLTISYTHTNEAGAQEGDITITNGAQSKTIHVAATTTKRPQTINWNADLASTGFAMNVEEQYPSEELIPVIATATNGERITFTSDNEEVIEVIADTALLAKAIGTANITAYQAGDNEYEEVSSTKQFTVTDLRKQSITWDQNLYGLLTTSGSVELTATATSGGPITYTSANTNIVKVEGNVLTVVGEGETYITATQAGYIDENEVEWLAVSQNNYVIVRNPKSQCNQMALSQGSLTLKNNNRVFDLSGIPATLTFTAKHGTKNGLWGTAPSYAPLQVEQFACINNLWDWYEVYNKVVGTDDTQSGNIALDESATKVRFSTIESGTDHTISNIQVSRKKFMRADITEVDQEAETNTAWQKTITVSHSNIDMMSISTRNGLLTLSQNTLGEGCGDFGDDAFTVSFTPTEKNQEYNDVIIITDSKEQPSTIEIPVRLTTKGLNQSINGYELPQEALATDEIAVSATASSGLEVSFHSSDSTVAYVEEGSLVILQAGTVTITATQEGNEKYDAALSIEKTIVINKVATTITTAPTAATIVYGQSLSESALTDGEASVVGTFAWENPDTKPVAGTPSYNVIFVPDQSNIYANATKLVSLRVEKATPVVTTWPTASEISIAQSLGDSELKNGEASVEGTFAWKNAAENRLHPGTYERTVVFTPNDENYNAVEGTVSVTVVNVLARIEELPTAVVENPVYGIQLSEVELQGGLATVAGSFAWANPDSVAEAGEHAYPVIFTPEDLEFYAVVNLEVSLTVAKATPEITEAPVATAIQYGQSVSASTLTGVATVAGSFAWTDSQDSIPAVGDHRFPVLFTPADANNYNTIDTAAMLTVTKANPVYTAPVFQSLTYTGEAQDIIEAGATEHGEIYYRLGEEGEWSKAIPTATNVGEYAIYYQVTGDENHNNTEVLGPINSEITKATAEVSVMPTASDLTYGQTLSESVFTGGEANTEGTYSWSNPEEQPEVGTAEYDVIFTPSDENYDFTYISVAVTVNKKAQTIEWIEELDPMVINGTRTFNATATSGLDVIYTSTNEEIAYFEGNVLHAIAPGLVTIIASQTGDEHYEAADSVARQIEVQNIQPVEPVITTAPEATEIIFGQTLGESELLNGVAEVEGAFAWAKPDTLLEIGKHSMDVIFTPADTIYYLPTTIQVEVTVNAPAPTYGDYTADVCEGDSIEYAGVWYSDSIATEVLLTEKNAQGGDSIVRLVVNIHPVYSFSDTLEIHAGMYDIWQGIAIGQLPEGDTTLVQSYQTIHGCDSTYTLHLSVLPMITTYGTDTVYLCSGEKLQYEGKTYRKTTTDSVLVSEKNIYGGDSIVNLVVYGLPLMKQTQSLTIKEGDSLTWQDIDLSQFAAGDTTLTVTYTTIYGCDSTFVLNLKVISSTPQTGFDQLNEEDTKAEKFFRNGEIYIRKNGFIYTLQGIKVKDEELQQ